MSDYFNPRLREGGDDYYILRPDGLKISIHASEKEATLDGVCVVTVGTTISIHASEKEATLGCTNSVVYLICISIHASEKEATATYCDTSTIMYISSLNNFFVRYF